MIRGKRALELLRMGWEVEDVADVVNLGVVYVTRIAKDNGILLSRKKTYKSKLAKSKIVAVIAMLQQGFNGAEIARKLHCSRQYVNQVKITCETEGVIL